MLVLPSHGEHVSEAEQRSSLEPPIRGGAQAAPKWNSLAAWRHVLSGANDRLTDDRLGKPGPTIRGRLESPRTVLRARFAGTKLMCNADMGPSAVPKFR